MDMGFSRVHCIEALLHTLSVEQATDYLLTNPATLRRSVCNITFLKPSEYVDTYTISVKKYLIVSLSRRFPTNY